MKNRELGFRVDGGSTWETMPARSVATVAREVGGGGLPTRDSSAGHALLPEWTVSGHRRAVELAPLLFYIVGGRERRRNGREGKALESGDGGT